MGGALTIPGALLPVLIFALGNILFFSGCRNETDKNAYLYAAIYYEMTKGTKTFASSCKLTYQCNNYYNGYTESQVKTLCSQYGGSYSTKLCTGTSALYYCRHSGTPSLDEIYYTGTSTTQASVQTDCESQGGSFGTGYPP